MKRPIGVAAISILHFCAAGPYLYSLIKTILFGVTVSRENNRDAADHGISALRNFLAGQPLEGWALLLGYI